MSQFGICEGSTPIDLVTVIKYIIRQSLDTDAFENLLYITKERHNQFLRTRYNQFLKTRYIEFKNLYNQILKSL